MLELFVYSPAQRVAPTGAAVEEEAESTAAAPAATPAILTAATPEDIANANKAKKTKKTKKKKKKKRSANTLRSSAMPLVAGMAALRVRIHDGESVDSLLRAIRVEAQGKLGWWGANDDEVGGAPSIDRMRLRHLSTRRALPEAPLLTFGSVARETTLAALRAAQVPPRRALQPRLPLYLEVRASADDPWEEWHPSLSICVIAVAHGAGGEAFAEEAALRGGEDLRARKTLYAAPIELRLRQAAPTVADLRGALAQHYSGDARAGSARGAERGVACAPWRLFLLRDGEKPLVLLDAQPLLVAPLALRSGATVHAERATSASYADVHSADAATSRVLADYSAALNLATFTFNELDRVCDAGGAVALKMPQTLVLHSIVQAPDVSKIPVMPMPTMPSVPVLPSLLGAPASGPAAMMLAMPLLQPMPTLPPMPALPPMPELPPAMGMSGIPNAPSAAMPALAAPARALRSVQVSSSMSPYAYLPMLTHLVCLHTLTYQFLNIFSLMCGGRCSSCASSSPRSWTCRSRRSSCSERRSAPR